MSIETIALRLVTWNCRGGVKFDAFDAMRADLLVLTEVSKNAVEHYGSRACWEGPSGGTGVAAIGANGWSVVRLAIRIESTVFLPIVARKADMQVLVVGCCVRRGAQKSYAKSALVALRSLVQTYDGSSFVLAGDFNMHGVGGGAARSRAFFAALETLGYKSVWHADRAESIGHESRMTYRSNRHKDFHIDYVFVPPAIVCDSVDTPPLEEYPKFSDHSPVVADLVWTR